MQPGESDIVIQIVPETPVTLEVTDESPIIIELTATGPPGGVDSVNGMSGAVVLDQDDVLDGTNFKQYSSADKTKLAGIEAGAQVNTVDSVNGETGDVILDKSDIGLGNVDNTSDANKPVSTAQGAAIAVVQADINAHEANTSNPHSVTKTQVGLGSADNTSDVNKPISTATQTALDAKQPLDADLTAIAGLNSGSSGMIASDGAGWIKKTYAQVKTALGLVKADVGLGNVDNTSDANKPVSTAQATAIGVVQSDINAHEANTSNPHSVTKAQVGLGNADNTSDLNKPISTATQLALNAKIEDIADLIEAGANVTITGSGTLADPYVVSSSGGGGGGSVDSVVAGIGIGVDDTDPVNPEVYLNAEIGQLLDVDTTSTLSDGDALLWDEGNSKWSVATPPGVVSSVSPGGGISVDDTDPNNPIVSNIGVIEISTGVGLSVDNTDPQIPVIDLEPGSLNSDDIAEGTTNLYMTDTEKTKLSGIEDGAQVNTVDSVAGKTGVVTLDSADVGLADVDNTSDDDKPISTATQTALDGKEKEAIEVTVTTARTTAAKVGTTSGGGYTPTYGDRINVTFTLGVSVNTPTLNIDGSGAANIRLGTTNVGTTLLSTAASSVTVPFWYDGTYWQMYGSQLNTDTNTTYFATSTFTAVTTTSQVAAVNSGYIANNAAEVNFTLPATASIGQVIEIVGRGAGGWRATAAAGDDIIINSNSTGAAGYISGGQYASVVLRCLTANTTWEVVSYTDVITTSAGYSTATQPLDADLTALAAAGNSSVLAATTASFLSADETKLDGIEAGADVTDATNVNAAGATMNSDTTLAGNGYFLDEDNMASDSATQVPSQQSVKAYADLKGALDYEVFASGGTWTKPAGATVVEVFLIGGGGGGGKGAAGAAGTTRPAGGGAGPGGAVIGQFQASDLGATEAVTVGAGGAAGTVSGAFNTGGNGGDSSFGSHVSAGGGGGGPSGNFFLVGNSGGAAGASSLTVGAGGGGAFTGLGFQIPGTPGHVGSGAGGAAISNANVVSPALAGGNSSGGAGGTAGGAASAGGAGADGSGTNGGAGGGGGGEASNGGDGGVNGGAGGGGGAALSPATAGNGGAGGDGIVIVITYG